MNADKRRQYRPMNGLAIVLGVILAWSFAVHSGYSEGWLAFAILISVGGAIAAIREFFWPLGRSIASRVRSRPH
jgi:hypothetical protein